MNSVWLIAKREYLERVRSKAFRVSTIVIPLAFAMIFGISTISSRLSGDPKSIVVVSSDRVLAESAATELSRRDGAQTLHAEARPDASPASLSELNSEVESKRIDGYLLLSAKPGAAQPETMYVSRGAVETYGRNRMGEAISRALIRAELQKGGDSRERTDALLKTVDMKSMQVKDGRLLPSNGGKRFIGAYAMAFLLYFAVVFYGVNVAQSVAAEKTSRVFEVLLASIEPQALMAGKLLGVAATGLTQMAIWVAVLLYLSATTLASTMVDGGLAAYGVTGAQLVFFIIYFLLGFFLYSALSLAVGAAVNQESDVQQFNMLIVMPQVLAVVLIVYVLGNPNAWPVVLLSLFPPFTHIVMLLRMSAMAVPWWQAGLSIVLMLAAIWGVLWVSSRIYRVGILMYGKPATMPEMMRWLRYK